MLLCIAFAKRFQLIVNALAVSGISIPRRPQSQLEPPSPKSVHCVKTERDHPTNTTNTTHSSHNKIDINVKINTNPLPRISRSGHDINYNVAVIDGDTPASAVAIGSLKIPKLEMTPNPSQSASHSDHDIDGESQTHDQSQNHSENQTPLESQLQSNKRTFSFSHRDQSQSVLSLKSMTRSASQTNNNNNNNNHNKNNNNNINNSSKPKSVGVELNSDQKMMVQIMAQNTTLVCIGVSTSIITCIAIVIAAAFPTYYGVSISTLIASADVTVNIICLSLQWSFSIHWYQKICILCDRCIKGCYAQRIVNDTA